MYLSRRNRFVDICPMYILCWYFVYDRHTFSMVRCHALLWQKEVSDKSPKSEKVILLDWTWHILRPFQVWSRNTHPAERYLIQDIMILHWCQCTWQTNFAHLREMSFSRVASFCQSTAVQFCLASSRWKNVNVDAVVTLNAYTPSKMNALLHASWEHFRQHAFMCDMWKNCCVNLANVCQQLSLRFFPPIFHLTATYIVEYERFDSFSPFVSL